MYINLPKVDKREKTAFNEFKLSNPESTHRRKTLIEYQQDLEKMKRACFKARSFDKSKFEKGFKAGGERFNKGSSSLGLPKWDLTKGGLHTKCWCRIKL